MKSDSKIITLSLKVRLTAIVFLATTISTIGTATYLLTNLNKPANTLIISVAAAYLITLIVCCGLTLVISQFAIINPLKKSSVLAQKIADGDLTVNMNFFKLAEVKEMIDSIDKARESLRKLVTEIKQSSTEVDVSSKTLTNIIDEENSQVKRITEGLQNLSDGFKTKDE